jgi:hypothetical protein
VPRPVSYPGRSLVSVVELAHDIGANGPRGDHGVLLAFGIGLLVGRADEPAFNKHVIAFEEVCGNALAEANPGDHAMTLNFQVPRALSILP